MGYMHTHMMRVTIISYIVNLWSDLDVLSGSRSKNISTTFKVSENLLFNYFIHEKVCIELLSEGMHAFYLKIWFVHPIP